MTEQIVDPQLAAFWASDPSIIHEPVLVADDVHHRTRLALEIGAAYLVISKLARLRLAALNSGVDSPATIAGNVWRDLLPLFTELVGAALRESFAASPISTEMSSAGAAKLAGQYAAGLGDYLGTTSIDAFTGGYEQQLAGRWSEKASWTRAAAGFGLDMPGFKSYLALTGTDLDRLVSPAAAARADAALLLRAQRIGDSEAATAAETARALGWLAMQRDGELPRSARRRWRLAHGETSCPICLPLDGAIAPLDKPFTVAGRELWAPQAHPNCRCHLELVGELGKAYNPQERREGPAGRNPSRWAKTTTADPAVQAMFDQAAALTEEEQATKTPSLFAAEARSPLFELTNLFPDEGPSATTAFLDAETGAPRSASAAFTGTERRPRATGAFTRRSPAPLRIKRRIMLMPPPRLPPVPGRAYYLPVDRYHAAINEHDIGALMDIHTSLDFNQARPAHEGSLTAQASSPWQVLTYDARAVGRIGLDKSGRHWATPVQVRLWWSAFMPDAMRGWDEAIKGAQSIDSADEGYVADLDPEDRERIAELAGFRDYSGDEDLGDKIVAAAQDMGTGDNSLACAYADYVVYQHPEILGSLGDEIAWHLDQGREALRIDLLDRPADQVLTFAQGFHPGTRRDLQEADPKGEFIVMGLSYRSALHDMGTSAPPLAMGVQEAWVQPYARHKGSFL